MTARDRQYAALPWRRGMDGDIDILLISSRETRRWVIPKGWPIAGLRPSESARREAFEEAGVDGNVAAEPLGSYRYAKRLRDGGNADVTVTVFALEVTGAHADWPEKGQRRLIWMSRAAAAEAVAEPELGHIIATYRADGESKRS